MFPSVKIKDNQQHFKIKPFIPVQVYHEKDPIHTTQLN